MTPRRIQRQRTKGWRMPANTIYVGRGSRWGNPYRVGPAIESAGVRIPEVTHESAVTLYREWLEQAMQTWPSTRQAVAALRGRNLACWCPPDRPCHADVLLELANSSPSDGGAP